MAKKPNVISGKKFDGVYVARTRASMQDVELQKCYFEGCTILQPKSPDARAIVRGVKLTNCSQRGCSIDAAIIEDTIIDGLATNGQLLQTWGTVFNRVVLKGKIDRLMICAHLFPTVDRDVVREKYRIADEAYYKNVKWALDISKGEFKELSIQGIPSHLIRRDPETQMVVSLEAAKSGKWINLKLYRDVWSVIFDILMTRGYPSMVLVAPKRHPKFKEYLADLNCLRDAGIAQP